MTQTSTPALSALMREAIVTASGTDEELGAVVLAGTRATERALIARGLAYPLYGNVERKNRYSRHAQTVYGAYLGARLTPAGMKLRAALTQES